MKHEISLWEAIREMRKITADGGSFGVVFMSYNRYRQLSQGPIRVNRARLRPATLKDHNQNADFMLNFLDLDQNLPRQMYQVSLMELNGKRIYLT